MRPRRLRGGNDSIPLHPTSACHCGECRQCGVVLCNKGFDFQKCQLFSEINGLVNPPPTLPNEGRFRIIACIIILFRNLAGCRPIIAPIPDNNIRFRVVSERLFPHLFIAGNRWDAYVLINSLAGQILCTIAILACP